MSSYVSISATAISYKVGVSPGEWAEYSETESLLTGSVKMRIDIISVNGTSVKLNETIYNANGSVAFRISLSADLASPIGSLELGFMLIPANLSAGENITEFGYKINETVEMSVAGWSRLCNHVSIHSNLLNSSVSEDYYWDQATGILVKSVSNVVSTEINLSSTTVMTSTDMFGGGSLGAGTIILVGGGVIVAVVIVVGLAAVFRSRKKSV
jgi:hypothetical protein